MASCQNEAWHFSRQAVDEETVFVAFILHMYWNKVRVEWVSYRRLKSLQFILATQKTDNMYQDM